MKQQWLRELYCGKFVGDCVLSTWNAGVFLVVLWIPEASESFFCSLQKGFSRSFQAVQEQNLQALTCTILLKPGKKKDPSLACRFFEGPKKRIRVWPAQRFLKPLEKGFHLRPARPKAFCPNGSSQQHKATSNPRKILLISHISPSH